jgi:hypothetical protein
MNGRGCDLGKDMAEGLEEQVEVYAQNVGVD